MLQVLCNNEVLGFKDIDFGTVLVGMTRSGLPCDGIKQFHDVLILSRVQTVFGT